MHREIINPRWNDIAKKDVIIATLRYTMDDGTVRDVKASIANADQPDGTSNPDWVEIMETFGESVVDQNTQERLDSIAEIQQQRREEQDRQRERQMQEEVFDTKLAIFENPIIQNLSSLDSKREIRRSDTINNLFINLVEAQIEDAFTRAGIDYVAPVSASANTA